MIAVVDCRFPYFMCHLLKGPVISTFTSKSHFGTIQLKYLNALHSVFWEFSNQSSAVYINVCMQKVSDNLFCMIFNNIITSYFWIM